MAVRPLLFDATPPGSPDISPTPPISSNPIDVVLSHPDDLDPEASPVALYYTLDGTAPTAASARYGGPFRLEVPDAAGTVSVRAIAVDGAGLAGTAEGLYDFQFLDIKKMSDPGQTSEDNFVGTASIAPVKDIHGFGFPFIDDANAIDDNGTRISVGTSLITDTLMRVTFNTDAIEDDPAGDGFGPGPGWLEITDTAHGVSISYQIVIQ